MSASLSPTEDRWLARISPPTREFIQSRGRMCSFTDGAHIYSLGDDPDGLYQVRSGEVRLIAYPVVGRQIVTLIARHRHWFGELSVLDGGPRPHDAVCHGNVDLLHVPMREITRFAESNPQVLGEIALISCDHQRAALSFIGTILSKSSKARLCEMILATAARQADDSLTLRISQEDLASRIGVSRQHLGQLLSELRTLGAITTSYGAIRIDDPVLLERLSRTGS